MGSVVLVQGIVGVLLLLVNARRYPASPLGVTGLQDLGGIGLLAVSLASTRLSPDDSAALWGWTGVGVAVWTLVVCFAAALVGDSTLLTADLLLGTVSTGLGWWVALTPRPAATPSTHVR